MPLHRYHPLAFALLLSAGQTTAFQAPKLISNTKSAWQLGASIAGGDRPIVGLQPDSFLANRNGNSAPKPLVQGTAYRSRSMQTFADSAAMKVEQEKEQNQEVSVPYDAAAKLAYEKAGGKGDFAAFKASYEAAAVADVVAKNAPTKEEAPAAAPTAAAAAAAPTAADAPTAAAPTAAVAISEEEPKLSAVNTEPSPEMSVATEEKEVPMEKSLDEEPELLTALALEVSTETAVMEEEKAVRAVESPMAEADLSVSTALAFQQSLPASKEQSTSASKLEAASVASVLPTGDALDLSKVSNVLSPAEGFEALVQKGEYNANSSTLKLVYSAILGGCYVGMGAMVSLAVAGNSPELQADNPGLDKFIFAALFPMNLLLAQQAGGSLFTGNTANMMAALCEKRVTPKDMARVLSLSWIGNFVGCGFFALACKYAGVMEGGAGALAAATLVTKTSSPLGPIIVKAMFCNWLVCLAVLLSTQAKDMGGKYISIWLPVSTFVSIGFEHSVANMFLLPAGLLSQNEITFETALTHNLIPVTFGNALSGAFLVGATMAYLYGSSGKEFEKNLEDKLDGNGPSLFESSPSYEAEEAK